MRGRLDDDIETRQAEGDGERRRSPGGKPLVRLLQQLESAGYTRTAGTTLRIAVPEEEAREEFRQEAAQFTAAPGGQALEGEPPPGDESEEPSGGAAVAEAVAQMYADASERLGVPTATGGQWRSLGPWTIPNGQTYGSNRVNVSGRISAIAVDPQSPAHVLAGAAGGGVWESRDRGASWAPRTDYASTLTVGALTFDPRSPSTVYCGTGEGNFYWPLGAGILRSTNGGTTWSTLCTAPFVGQGFYDLIVDPANSQHLLAATTGGLYVSTNGGLNWTRRRTATTWSLSMAPAGGPSAEILAGCSDGVKRSTDGGTTWNAVALPGAPATFDRLAVAIARSNPAVAYAWGSRAGTPYLRRRAAGTWSSVGAPPGVNTGQAWYDWFLAVAPDRDTQVYCGAIEVHRGDLLGTTWTWRNLTNKGATGP